MLDSRSKTVKQLEQLSEVQRHPAFQKMADDIAAEKRAKGEAVERELAAVGAEIALCDTDDSGRIIAEKEAEITRLFKEAERLGDEVAKLRVESRGRRNQLINRKQELQAELRGMLGMGYAWPQPVAWEATSKDSVPQPKPLPPSPAPMPGFFGPGDRLNLGPVDRW